MVNFHQKYDISESLSIISCYYYSNNNYIPSWYNRHTILKIYEKIWELIFIVNLVTRYVEI